MKKTLVLISTISALLCSASLQAQTLYWDTNGTNDGASDGTAATGVWGVDNFWSADSTGKSATGAFTPGSAVIFSAGTAPNSSTAYAISVSGVQSVSGITIQEGTVTLGAAGSGGLQIGSGGITMSSSLPGNFALSVNLASGVELLASQTWSNPTAARDLTINTAVRGSAAAAATQTLTINGQATQGSAAGISDGEAGGNLGLTKTGSGTLTLNSVNTYSGGTTISQGLLRFGTTAGTVPATGLISLGAAGGLVATGPASGGFNSVQGWLDSGKLSTASSGVLAFVSTAQAAGTASLDFSAYPSLYLGATINSTTYNGALTVDASGYKFGGGGGSMAVGTKLTGDVPVMTRSTTITLTGDNDYTGQTDVASGTLVAGTNTALGSTSAGTVVTTGSVALANGVSIPAGESLTISGTGGNVGALTTATGSGGQGTWNGSVTLASADARVGARSGTTLTIAGPISGTTGSQDLNFSGENGLGTLLLASSANTYTGETRIIRGKLMLGTDDALPATTVVDMHPLSGAGEASVLDLNGYDLSIAGLKRSNSNAGATVTNSAAGPVKTLTLAQEISTSYGGQAGAVMTPVAPGTIAGNLSLRKTGAGDLTLQAANTYTGGTVLVGGSIIGSANQAFGTGDVSVESTAVRLSINTGVSNAIADGRTLSLSGGGVIDLADNGYLQLATGVNETVNMLFLGGVAQLAGTYGSLASAADFKSDEYFSGAGVLTVAVPEPASAALLLAGLAGLAGIRGRRRA